MPHTNALLEVEVIKNHNLLFLYTDEPTETPTDKS